MSRLGGKRLSPYKMEIRHTIIHFAHDRHVSMAAVVFRMALVVAAVCIWAPAFALEGVPTVLDGDSIELAGKRLHLDGIDAPEKEQLCLNASGQRWSCGIEALNKLKERGAGRP